jgi:hypothetical protein
MQNDTLTKDQQADPIEITDGMIEAGARKS